MIRTREIRTTISCAPGRRRETTTFGNPDGGGTGTKVETRTYRPDNLPVSQGIPNVTGFAYGWDANKRKTQQNDAIVPQNVQDYDYDNEDRLTDYSRTNGDTQTWGLSLEGDWNNTIITQGERGGLRLRDFGGETRGSCWMGLRMGGLTIGCAPCKPLTNSIRRSACPISYVSKPVAAG